MISNAGPVIVSAAHSTTPSPAVIATIANAFSVSRRERQTGVASSRSSVLPSSSPAIRAGAGAVA